MIRDNHTITIYTSKIIMILGVKTMNQKLEITKKKCARPECTNTFEVLPGWEKQYCCQRCANGHRAKVQEELWTPAKRKARSVLQKKIWKARKEDEAKKVQNKP